ncbi:hypothetical protein RD149_00690 [Gordonia westfalica]|uniref:LuxR family transcriptional regulator n=1 Tax=Gordonia westfalica TaxID=158898 RepID=A0ABU2GLD0_9ACTN|nr:hypothetical protein [Gordonia westfalica]MDS1112278.1 hypothetical protein [Gordonia westfalica]
MLNRVDRLPGGVARLASAVPDEDITRCLHLLVATVMDVTGASTPEVRDTIRQWRQQGSADPTGVATLRMVAAQHDFDSFAHQRRGEIDRQLDSFRRARALDCVLAAMAVSTAAEAPRTALREAAYEAAAALGGSAGVVGVLADFVV